MRSWLWGVCAMAALAACDKQPRDGGGSRAGLSDRRLLPDGALPRASIRSTGAGDYTIDPEVVTQALLEHAVGDVVFVRDEDGYQLSAMRAGSIFARLGLFPGDRVRTIAGIALRDRASLLEAYGAAMGQNPVRVDVVRDGKPTILRYQLADPASLARGAYPGLGAAGSVPSATPPPAPMPPDFADSIERVSDEHVRIKQKLLDELRKDPALIMKQSRIVPSIKNGQPNGIKLYAVRPSSIFAAVTIMNGDTIVAVNGTPIAFTAAIDGVFPWMPNPPPGTKLEYDILRRGQAKKLVLEIVK